VIEVRNKGISKGEAVKTILNANDYDFIFACGDDTTDEDMFQQLSFIADSYTFKVGLQGSYASFNLNDTDQVFSLLESFEAAVCAG
jgi:trehalose 6-phosphate synthase/phosphatase